MYVCRKLSIFRREYPNVPIMALTATATPRVSQDILLQLGMRNAAIFTSSFNRPNLVYHVLKKGRNVIEDMAKRLVERSTDQYTALQQGIVYCLSRADCEKVTHELSARISRSGSNCLVFVLGLPNCGPYVPNLLCILHAETVKCSVSASRHQINLTTAELNPEESVRCRAT